MKMKNHKKEIILASMIVISLVIISIVSSYPFFGKALKISGTIYKNESIDVFPIWVYENISIVNISAGNYTLELIDGSSNVINITTFEPAWFEYEFENESFFFLEVYYPQQAEKLRIWNHTLLLYEVNKSTNAPVLSSINIENKGNDVLNLSWIVSDSDGDETYTKIGYNCSGWSDTGITSLFLGEINSSYKSAVFNFTGSPGGSSCFFQIRSTDSRMHTTTAYSEEFSLSNKPPIVYITEPYNESIFSNSTIYVNDTILNTTDITLVNISFMAGGWDSEYSGINMSEFNFTWSSDIDGYLGNGSWIETTLSGGNHTILVNLSNADGDESAVDVISVQVIGDYFISEVKALGAMFYEKPILDTNFTFVGVWKTYIENAIGIGKISFYASDGWTLIKEYFEEDGYAGSYSFTNLTTWNFSSGMQKGIYNITMIISNVSTMMGNVSYNESNTADNIVNTTFRVYDPLNDTNKFYIIDYWGYNMSWLGDEGNIVLGGGCYNYTDLYEDGSPPSSVSAPEDSFIVQGADNENVSWFDSYGNMYVKNYDCWSDLDTDCNDPSEDAFIISNLQGENVTYIDVTGKMCLKGGLFEYSDDSRLNL